MNRNRQWLYAKQPVGKINADTFQWHEAAMPVAQPGEVLVKTRMLSLDPANRA
jgi:NADPH-dependent curcumin reductase CurA